MKHAARTPHRMLTRGMLMLGMLMPAVCCAVPGVAFAQGTPSFDGRYGGEIHWSYAGVSSHGRCVFPNYHAVYTVRDGILTIPSPRFGALTGPVGPDGSFSLRDPARTATGRIAAGTLTGTYVSGSCQSPLNMQKQ